MSFIPEFRNNIIYSTLDKIFAYVLAPIRRVVPPIGGTLDISPIILMLLLGVLFKHVLVPLLAH